jgi:rfaE bifunctional protein nucleotidyltransferase chain/domain
MRLIDHICIHPTVMPMNVYATPAFENKICAATTLAARVAQLPRPLVFTNGCFDVLHRGHIEYLHFCKSQGNIVVVGLNSDSSVKQIKGPDRPINNQHDRAAVLAALESVAYVVTFEEPDPLELIKKVRPDVLVKGEDWAVKGVVGREFVESYGGKVVLAKLVDGKSSTATIEKMKSLEKKP